MPRKPKQDPSFTISNNIRTLRFHADEMTQQQLAQAVGVTRQTINAIEGGKYTPSLDVAFRIARAFNARVEDVFECSQQIADDSATNNAIEQETTHSNT